MQICPSILESSAADFDFQIKRLSPYFNYFQIDIADGLFVPNKTVQIENLLPVFQQLNHVTMKPLVFDFHLMVKDYDKEIKKLLALRYPCLAGRQVGEGGGNLLKINNIFIHYSLLPNFSLLTTNYSFPIGLVLNPQDQVSDLAKDYNLNKIPVIQIMSIHPGRQGSPFLQETLKKIEQLRQSGYRSKIFLDGAINNDTLSFILKQKFLPDVLCPGSYLSRAEDLKKNINYLKSKIIV